MLNNAVAAIDLGTNSCRLLIADRQGNVLYRDTQAVRLGEKMSENMAFTSEAMQRGYETFCDYAAQLKKYNVGQVRAIATAACRMANNGGEFVKNVKKHSGVSLEVIDGMEEARLNLKGAVMNSKGMAPYVLVYDLGGGSTEITLATNDDKQDILHSISIPLGARNAAEIYHLENEFNVENSTALRQKIKSYTDAFKIDSDYEKFKSKCCFVATSSNPLRLSAWIHQRGSYDRMLEDGQILYVKDMNRVIDEIQHMSREERSASVYIGEKRAPIFLSAGVIFKTIYDELGMNSVLASLKGAQEAIVEELIAQYANQEEN